MLRLLVTKIGRCELLLNFIPGACKISDDITSVVEFTNIPKHCFWLPLGNEELAVLFSEFPWFKQAAIEQISNVEWPTQGHLCWPMLDIDLSV